jgi:hypothetical protein
VKNPEAARQALLDGVQRMLEEEPGGPHMVVGIVAAVEFINLDDGEPLILMVSSDDNAEMVPFWRILGYSEYVKTLVVDTILSKEN